MDSSTPTAAPFLKWPGGKTKLLKELLARTPTEFNAYHEPFVGGGALFFALYSQGRIKAAHLGDISPLLVNCYQQVRADVEQVITLLKSCENTADFYYATRAKLNGGSFTPVEKAAATVYLNKTCFNGLFRVNRKGEFNAAWGHYEAPKFCNEIALRSASTAFQKAEIRLEGYKAVADRALPGDFVYFDPPYIPLTESADFTEYTADGFSMKDQYELRDLFVELGKRGVKALLSNSDTPNTRVLYQDFQIHQVFAARVINRVATKRGRVAEVMVSNF